MEMIRFRLLQLNYELTIVNVKYFIPFMNYNIHVAEKYITRYYILLYI